jgi:hypothetical protein
VAGFRKGIAGLSHRCEGDGEAFELEVGHDVVEAASFVAEERSFGDKAVFEGELGGVGGPPAEFLQ